MEVPCIRQRIDCCAHRSDDGCVSLEYVNKGGTASSRPFWMWGLFFYANNESKPMLACGFDVAKRQWRLFCNVRNGVQTYRDNKWDSRSVFHLVVGRIYVGIQTGSIAIGLTLSGFGMLPFIISLELFPGKLWNAPYGAYCSDNEWYRRNDIRRLHMNQVWYWR